MKNKLNLPLKQIVKNSIFSFLILFSIVSCENSESEIKKSIENLTEKHPQLMTDKTASESEFKFVKSVKEGEFNTEIQLFSQEQGSNNRNHILVFINGKKEIYAVPFFNNKYRDYWGFPFEKKLPKVPKINTTFSKEMNIGINKLIPNSDRRKSLKRLAIFDVMLNSLLNCQRLSSKDSLIFSNPVLYTPNIPDENLDSTKVRLRKNYKLMKLNLHPDNLNSNCYLDRENGRIYQIEYLGNKIQIKAYRMDFGFHAIYL